MLQTKHAALEPKYKELMLQQSGSVNGASAALAGLHSRLDSLVGQLVVSYSISEQDLEVSWLSFKGLLKFSIFFCNSLQRRLKGMRIVPTDSHSNGFVYSCLERYCRLFA